MAGSRNLPPLRALRVFEAAARQRGFAGAARELCLTQPAVSQQIKLLEEWYGVPLFVRGHNDVKPTPQAEALLPTVRAAFDAIDDASRQVRGEPSRLQVRIAAMPNVAMNWLAPRLGRLLAAVPGIAVDVVTEVRPLSDVFRDCDLAIHPYQPSPQYAFEPLLTTTMFPVAHPSLVARGRLRTAADLARVPLIHFARAPGAWRDWFEAAGVPGPESAPALRFDSQMIVIEAARAGLGVALGWSVFNEADLAAGRLVAPFDLRVPSEQAWFLVRPKALRNQRIEPVRRWLLDEARG